MIKPEIHFRVYDESLRADLEYERDATFKETVKMIDKKIGEIDDYAGGDAIEFRIKIMELQRELEQAND